MDVIFELGEASVSDVHARIPDPPSYSAVRTMIRYLEAKGLLRHRREGTRYIYRPSEAKESVRRSVLPHLIKTFFGGSTWMREGIEQRPAGRSATLLTISRG
jgi:predicted transcriptional regulator